MKKLVCALAVIALTGCASVVNDKNQNVKITASNGQEIKGTVQKDEVVTSKEDGKLKKTHVKTPESSFSGKTNSVVMERSNANKVVVVENPECTKETELKSSVSPMFFGNILIGGLLGSTTDSATQKMWQYDENVVVNCK